MTGYTVIGANGFVGSHVVDHLRGRGIEPFCPVRDDPRLWDRDLGRIFYCAGLTGDYRSRPFATVEAHVALLARLLERARFDRIVYLSSTRLYGSQAGGEGRETLPIAVDAGDHEHLYELSKLLGENLTLHRSDGRGVVARLSYVFGWDDRAEGFLSEWLRRAAREREISLDSSPGYARDYIHIDDVVVALKALLDRGPAGIVNVARGETVSNVQLAELFAAQGWRIAFTRGNDGGSAGERIDAARLVALGMAARPILPLISGFLDGLK
ncbi:NAD-dependent epimerase/dehydratase family protein [Rhizorhabdus dicambivorans]|uniref:NAD-dependent epimerase/dehydratase n=1 Tax=Rhizorhabdus dicambivorans TaxID=1850238 RepID=A0A2A4FPA2_9SPHN|nr:SDR family oxidoreductase [Rhizorhabdus dicambivorans]ATE64040.1 NAD-dependent epimerase/dehydratase [Rhizorhabdus dicambivorans]PCE40233.1 NAD-dependent epimerase/dehydratase [Rhizorhabdus dicambivorans]